MTISKKDLKEAYDDGYVMGHSNGVGKGKAQVESELSHIRRQCITDLTKAAAELAQANAKLTYSLSQIANKLL